MGFVPSPPIVVCPICGAVIGVGREEQHRKFHELLKRNGATSPPREDYSEG